MSQAPHATGPQRHPIGWARMFFFVRGGDLVLGWHQSHFWTNEANKLFLY